MAPDRGEVEAGQAPDRRPTVLILTAGFGEGHNAAARNLALALRSIEGGRLEAVVADPLNEAYGRFFRWSARRYLWTINHLPGLWSWVYRSFDRHGPRLVRSPTATPVRRALGRLLRRHQPVAIVSTFPAYNYSFDNWSEPLPPRTTVITDAISVNRIWTGCAPHPFSVGDETTAASVRAHGVPSEFIHVFGFPVSSAFAGRTALGARPDLAAGGRPRILYLINSGRRHAPETIRRLLTHAEWDLTVVVGRDAAMGEVALELLGDAGLGPGGRAEVLGWTNEVPRLLLEHHVLVSKAGGATTAEALAALTPMVVSQVVPGQEEGNWELLRQSGAGRLALDPATIENTLVEVLAPGGAAWRAWQQRLLPVSRPDAVLRLAQFVVGQVSAWR